MLCSVKLQRPHRCRDGSLTGAAVAALAVYDMYKALSPEIEIRRLRLVEKRGGKRDFLREEELG